MRRKVNAFVAPVETQDDSFVTEAFLHHPPTSSDLVHEIDRALLEDTRLDDGFDVVARMPLEDNPTRCRASEGCVTEGALLRPRRRFPLEFARRFPQERWRDRAMIASAAPFTGLAIYRG